MECGRYFHRIGGFRRDFSRMARDCRPGRFAICWRRFCCWGFSYLLSYLSGRRQSLPSGMDLAIGLVLVLAALLVAVKADQIIGLIPMVMGAVFAINGAVKLQRSVELKQVQYRGWGVVMFYAILTIGFGVLLLFNPFSAATMMVRILGIGLLVSGGTDIITMMSVSRQIRKDMLPGVSWSKRFFLKKERFSALFLIGIKRGCTQGFPRRKMV